MAGGGIYVIELDRWGIKNDGTSAENTTMGINSALLWASQQGYAEAVLSKGTYLIDENNSIRPQSFMTLNLGGSTLRIRDNRLIGYSIVTFDQGQTFSRITNGIIQGDRNTHDYSNGDTNEFGEGINIKLGATYITVDNLEILDTTGDAIQIITSYGGIGGLASLSGNLEMGGINTLNGTLISSTTSIRSTIKIPMTKPEMLQCGYFGLYGDSYGGVGTEITTDIYDVIFYKADDTFLSSAVNNHFFDEVKIPKNASYAKVVIYQPIIPSVNGCTITIRAPQFPRFVYIEKCDLHTCRRLGVAICGGKHIYIRDCDIHDNYGIAPQGGIDIEDGYDLNQYISIERNNIYGNNSYSISAIAGRHINISNNRISSGIFTINNGVNHSIVENNHFINADPRLTGDVIFSNNEVYGSRMLINASDKEVLVDNCFFQNSSVNISKTKAYSLKISNCSFVFNADFYNAYIPLRSLGSPLIFSGQPQILSNCKFEGYGKEAFTAVSNDTSGDWFFENVTFLNIRHPENRITRLPPGIFTGCNFINSGMLSTWNGNLPVTYEFKGCTFQWDSYTLFYFNANSKVNIFKISNSRFLGGSSSGFFFNSSWGRIEFTDNLFDFPNSSSSSNIIEFYDENIADNILIQGNRFKSNKPMVAVKTNTLKNAAELIFKDNFIETVTLKLKDTTIKINNYIDRVLDPYYVLSMPPTIGYFRDGQIIRNSHLSGGGFLGWICVVGGYAEINVWTASKFHQKGDRITKNGHVFECQTNYGRSSIEEPALITTNGASVLDNEGMTKWMPNKTYLAGDLVIPVIPNGYFYSCSNSGTSGSTEPSWLTANSSKINDGTAVWTLVSPILVWKEIGLLAVFKQFGEIQA